jgi:beta-galactosidase
MALQLAAGVALPLATGPAGAAVVANEALAPDRRDQLFDRDWRFFLGDGARFAAKDFDDRSWRRVELPHDWSIEDQTPSSPATNALVRTVDTAPLWERISDPPKDIGPFSGGPTTLGAGDRSAGAQNTGYTIGGVGWYRKTFRLPPLTTDAAVELVFDGVYMNAEVWLNGRSLGEHPYGYTPFGFELTPHLDRTGENVVAVRVANLGRNSRWYSGSGIYRHVRVNVTRALRFARWGIAISTPLVSDALATVEVRAKVEALAPGAMFAARVHAPDGKVVAERRTPAEAETRIKLQVPHPRLWSPESPQLYRLECELLADERRVDRMSSAFGIRRVEIDARNGLRINGAPFKLRGGCIHHDNGLLGAVAIDRAEERKIELLKARGFNAIRTAHNPPSPALLDACDRLGMLVMEEPFDCWRVGKNPDDHHLYFDQWWREDVTAMVARDGNHPSVILWGIGNEIPETGKPDGVETGRMLAAELRRLDPTRPITQAINTSNGPDVTDADGRPNQAATQFLDIVGYNYKLEQYEPDHARFPERVLLGTESYPRDVDAIWRLTDASPYLIGDFVWAAMDYLGEAGCGAPVLSGDHLFPTYPFFGCYEGDIDLIGQQKPQSWMRDVVWGLSPLEVGVQRPLPAGSSELTSPWGWRDELQSWTWPGAEGQTLKVRLYTRGDRVELALDGRKLGEKTLIESDMSMAEFEVAYTPGRLTATAFRGGREISRKTIETVGAPAALRLRPDRTRIQAHRNDLAFVVLEVLDEHGRVVADAVEVFEVGLSGPAELAACGNANPRGLASFRQPVAKTWHGRALAIVRPIGGVGPVVVEARAKGLKPATARIQIQAAQAGAP